MKKQRVLGLVMAVLMVAMLMLTGCTQQTPAPEGESSAPAPASDSAAAQTSAPSESAADSAAPAAADGEKITIGISTDAGFPARAVEVIGLYDKAKESGGKVEIVEQNADNDSTKQIQQIKSMVDQGVDAIVVCAVDMNAVQTALDYADSKGVIVTLYDRVVDHPAVKFTGAYDSKSDGVMCGEALAELDDGEDHVVFEMVGSLSDTNAIARSEGFHSVIDDHKNLQIVQIQTDWDVAKALSGLQNALQKYPDVWAIFNASGHMDGSVQTALQEIDRWKKVGEDGHVILISLGGEPPSYEIAADGYTDVFACIPFDQMGGAIYDAIMKLTAGEQPAEDIFYCKTFAVPSDQMEAQKENIFTYKYADIF